MANPVLAEVRRGSLVESGHRGSVAVVDSFGRVRCEVGDRDRVVVPRSSVKPVQALPLVASGAVERFGLGDRHLALACSSHRGEPAHVAALAEWLARLGLDESALECGVQDGRPSALHHNCSGKHVGFLTTAVHAGEDPRGYIDVDHPVQRRVRDALTDVFGDRLTPEPVVDGCGIPLYGLPLADLASSLIRLISGSGLDDRIASGGRRLVGAMRSEPWWVAGTGSSVTDLSVETGGALVAKSGAEGVFVVAWPEAGLGVAVKIDDGARRAADVVTAGILARLSEPLVDDVPSAGRVRDWATRASSQPLSNAAGRIVGAISATIPSAESWGAGRP